MSKLYSTTVFIGRFNPFHNGHKSVIDEALKISDKVLVLIGSANRPRSSRNPFTYEERLKMLELMYLDDIYTRVFPEPLNDILYNDHLWSAQVQAIVASHEPDNNAIALIGHKKDASSYYIDLFPQWDNVGVTPYINHFNKKALDASYIREQIYLDTHGNLDHYTKDIIDKSVTRYLTTLDISEPKEEFFHAKKYKKQFEVLPYPPIFQTVDAVVVQSGHILLVERGAMPGKGLLALPGGFLNEKERLIDGAIRELREETKLKVPTPVLYGNITRRETFDDPYRSSRGRTITTAFAINLPPGKLPKVKGSDDAKKAFWKPIAELDSKEFFEDHYDIVKCMVGHREKTD